MYGCIYMYMERERDIGNFNYTLDPGDPGIKTKVPGVRRSPQDQICIHISLTFVNTLH